jgi:hypothetical protein
MTANPQHFFRFAASHYLLLVDLFYRREGVNDVELYAMIERRRSEEDPSVYHVADQLLKLGILESVPDATATYEMTRQVQNLFTYLLREHRLTSVTVIQAYLNDLDQLGEELREAIHSSKGSQAARAMAEISDLVERIRQDSGANREAVINEVMTVKSNPGQMSVRERFERINRLWTRYLVPLRDLIDVRKAMDHSLDSMEGLALEGMKVFNLDGALARELARIRARLLRLRRNVAADFRESMREIEPLYQALRRESQLVRGASRALALIRQNKGASLRLSERMALPAWRLAGLFSDTVVAALFYNIKGYSPGRIPAIPHALEAEAKDFIDPETLLEAFRSQMPIKDVLEWLNLNFEKAPLAELLRAYGRIFNSSLGRVTFGSEERTYRICGNRVTAYPMQVEHLS